MTRFVAFGDTHFGAGDDYGDKPGERLKDQIAALEMVVDVAIDGAVDGVLFAGDAFDGPIVTPEHYAAFRRPLRRLAAAGIPAVGVSGNGRHDCAMRSVNALEVVGDVLDVHREPGVVKVADAYVAVLPWVSVGRLVAAHDGGDRDVTNAEVSELLLQIARDLYAQIPTGAPSLLLGHWSLTGAHLPNGLPVDDLREPVIETAELLAVGFDFCVFGHIHVPGPVSEALDDKIIYTGPLTATSFGEAGVDHGCWRIEIGDDVFGRGEYEFVPLAERPFVTIDCDLTTGAHVQLGLDETDAVAAAIAGYFPIDDAVVRIRYRADEEQARRIDWPKLRGLLAPAHKVYAIVGDITRTDRVRVAGVDEDLAPLAALDLWMDANDVNGVRGELVDVTTRYLQEVAL